ncbi:MAG: sigma-70 family RNA polymerase sigma factor [Chloroflexota bacterium]
MPEKKKPRSAYSDSAGEDAELFAQYSRTRSPEIREKLIVRQLGWVAQLARRLSYRPEHLDDLIQVAYLGLIKAIDRYDPSRGVPFKGYAVPTVVGEIQRYYRDKASVLRTPRLRSKASFAPATVTSDGVTSGRPDREAGQRDLFLIHVLSLDQPAEGGVEGTPLEEQLSQEDRAIAEFEDRATVSQIISRLSPREQIILYLRFYRGLSQAQVAQRLKISQMHVSRLQRRALEKIKQAIERD